MDTLETYDLVGSCRAAAELALTITPSITTPSAARRTFRRIGWIPTYVLTDNEKTVTLTHVAGPGGRCSIRTWSPLAHVGNLRLRCPNCHAFTPTYRGRNIGRAPVAGHPAAG